MKKRVYSIVFTLLLVSSSIIPFSAIVGVSQSTNGETGVLRGTPYAWPGPSGTQVDTWDGSLTLSRTETELPGRIPIMIAFSYHSLLRNDSTHYGYGWRFAHDVYYVADEDEVTVIWGNGGSVRFQRETGGGYVSPSGVSDVFEEYSSQQFRLTTKEGFQFYFEDADHQHVTKVVDRCGNALHFTYNVYGLLTAIEDSSSRVDLYYDDLAQLKWIHLPNREITFAYDDDGNLKEILTLDPDTLATLCMSTYSYDSDHFLTGAADPKSRTTSIEYVEERVTHLQSPLTETTFGYDLVNNVTTVTESIDAITQTVQFFYDSQGRCQQMTDELGNAILYEWGETNIVAITDQRGHTTEYNYDSQRNPVAIIDALGNTINYTYDATYNKVTSFSNPNGNVWRMEYDAGGDLVRRTNPLGTNITYQYNAYGDEIRVTYPDHYIEYEYNERGLISRTTDSSGISVDLTYDSSGNLIQITDSNGGSILYEYDSLDRIIGYTDKLGQQTEFFYDEYNNLVKRIDPVNGTTDFEYDALDRVVRVVNSLGYETIFDYAASSHSKTLTDPLGRTITFTYDNLGRLIQETDALGYTVNYGYDEVDNMVNMTDQNGATTYFVYDALDRLITIDYPDDNDVHYTYDGVGNIVTIADANTTIQYEYDVLNRIISVTDVTHGKTTSYTYDENTHLVQMVDPFGATTTYTYDAQGLLSTLTDSEGQTTRFLYNSLGQLVEKTYANDVNATFSHDDSGQLLTLLYTNASGQPLMGFEYDYDALGNKVRMVDLDGNITLYGYDALNQLVNVTYPDSSVVEYTYDAVGNRLSMVSLAGTVDYLYDAGNRLLEAGDVSYEWDQNGNLITKNDVGGETTYTYDYQNRLTAINYPDGTLTHYDYYPNGQLLSKDVDGQITNYLYSGPNVLYELDDGWNPVTGYTTIGLDNRISMTQNGDSYVYLYNHIGSVVGLTDSSGQLVTRYQYDAFGSLQYSSGAVSNSYFFIGREYDEKSELYNMRARNYDPETGRFTTRDPLTNYFSPYVYAANNPVNLVDPTGLIEGAYSPPSECLRPEFYEQARQFLYTPTSLKDKQRIWEDVAASGATDPNKWLGGAKYTLGKWESGLIGEMEWLKKNFKSILWGAAGGSSLAGGLGGAGLSTGALGFYGNSYEPVYLVWQANFVPTFSAPANYFIAKPGPGGFHLGVNANFWKSDWITHIGIPEHVAQTRFGQWWTGLFGRGKVIQGTAHYFPLKAGAKAALILAFLAAPIIGTKGCDSEKAEILPDPDKQHYVSGRWDFSSYDVFGKDDDQPEYWDETWINGTIWIEQEDDKIVDGGSEGLMARYTLRHSPEGVFPFGPLFGDIDKINGTLEGNILKLTFFQWYPDGSGVYHYVPGLGFDGLFNKYGTLAKGYIINPHQVSHTNSSQIRISRTYNFEMEPHYRIEPRYGYVDVTAKLWSKGQTDNMGGPTTFENLTPDLATLSDYVDLGPLARIRVTPKVSSGIVEIKAATPYGLEQTFQIEISPTDSWIVGEGEEADFSTIQEAIDAATPGSTIYLEDPGEPYRENIVINKPLTLMGDGYGGGATIDGGAAGNTVTITADNVVVQGLTITNSSADYPHAGIFIDYANNTVIRDNDVSRNTGHGIFVMWGSNNTIENNQIHGNDGPGLRIDGPEANATISGNYIYENQGDGIFLYTAHNVLIDGNMVEENGGTGITPQGGSQNVTIQYNYLGNNIVHGIYVAVSTDIYIAGNYIKTNGELGIYLRESYQNKLYDNVLVNDGLYARDSSENTVEGNTINDRPLIYLENEQNQTVNDAGQVILINCEDIRVQGLTLSSVDFGLELWHSNNTYIVNNNFTNNLFAMLIYSSTNNTFYHNRFVENTRGQIYFPAYGTELPNIWNQSYPSGGNYWSDYTGSDENSGPYQNITGSDGVGDSPYIINGVNVDQYPLMSSKPRTEVPLSINGGDYSAIITGNTTVSSITTSTNSIDFTASGPSGEIGNVLMVFPAINTTAIRIYVDGVELVPPPFPVFTTNGTHYFIYFEFTLSTHQVTLQFGQPTIESCNSAGEIEDIFTPTHSVYVKGSGYAPSTTYDIYIVDDISPWIDGNAIPARISGTLDSVTSNATGAIPPTAIWLTPLIPGKYDIVVDVNGDGYYNASVDALDESYIQIEAGFHVIPEYLLGTILGVGACFAALAVFYTSSRKKISSKG